MIRKLCFAYAVALALSGAPSAAAVLGVVDETKLTSDAPKAADLFGWSVAMSGTTAVIGSPQDDGSADDAGSAYVFDLSTGMLIHTLFASDAEDGDQFGHSVAISGDRIVVGAMKESVRRGAAYVFDRVSGNQLSKISLPEGEPGDNFGWSIAVEGSTTLIASLGDDDGTAPGGGPATSSGAAYVFDTETGNQLQKLKATDPDVSDNFGVAVALSGGRALVGANRDDDDGESSGAAYVFDAATGTQLQKLTASDAVAGDEFGNSVAMLGDLALVGAEGASGGTFSGAAYLFNVMTGAELFKLMADDAENGDSFGQSVALSGTIALIGALGTDDDGDSSGSVYLFDTITGQQIGKVTASDAVAGDLFGQSVSLSGDTALVGAFGVDTNDESVSGAAYALTLAPVPLPAGVWFLGSALVLLVLWRRRAARWA